MGRRVPVDLEGFRMFGGQNLEIGIFLEGTCQVPKVSIHACNHGVVSQARADGFRDVQGAAAGWYALLAPIGQSNGKAFTHVTFRLSGYFNFAFSALAWIRIGTSGSAFFHSARKSW